MHALPMPSDSQKVDVSAAWTLRAVRRQIRFHRSIEVKVVVGYQKGSSVTVWRQQKVLGNEHPDTLRSINNLALVLSDQGKYEEAGVLCLNRSLFRTSTGFIGESLFRFCGGSRCPAFLSFKQALLGGSVACFVDSPETVQLDSR
jgi:Tetratricopeptide repeat